MKLGQNMRPNDILIEFQNDSGLLINMAPRGRDILPYMATYGYSKTLLKLQRPRTFIVPSS